MRIGEVASRAGVSIQAVRLYERRGLLKRAKRLSSGYRDYPADAVAFIRFIKKAQEHGFTLDEIKSLIHMRELSSDTATEARELARAKIALIDEKIKRLQSQRDAIEHGLNICRCSEKFPICLLAKMIEQSSTGK